MQPGKQYDFGEMSFLRVLGVMGVLLVLVAILLLLTPDMQTETLSWHTPDDATGVGICTGSMPGAQPGLSIIMSFCPSTSKIA